MTTSDHNTIRVPLTRGKFATIDAVDADLLNLKWSASHWSYAVRANDKHDGLTLMHRLILERKLVRTLLADEMCDHIDGNTLNNTRDNLRVASIADNVRNSRIGKNNSSGYKGVHFHKGARKWRAQITVNRKVISLGYFETPVEAALAYNDAALKHYGEFAKLNEV